MHSSLRGMGAPVVVLGMLLLSMSAGLTQAAPPATSSRPAPLDLRQRVEAYRPFDGSGRYTMEKDDGVRGIQGLWVLASRYGVKPYKELSTGEGTWQTERVIFKDVDTGATVMRLTNDPWADQLSYFQGNWSADGRTIVWRRRPGMWESSTATHGPIAMNADGTGMRNVFRDYPMVRGEVCSPADANLCYAAAKADTEVVAFDLNTGRTHHVVRSGPRGWHMKISPDGKYLMNRSDISKGGKGLWIAAVDGNELHEIPVPEAIHDSYRFHPSQRKIMFWYEGKFREEGFVQCDFDGGGRTKVNVQFDWNHGDVGCDRGVHCEGYVTPVKGDTWGPKEFLFHKPGQEYYDDPADYNGYTTWWPKDRLWVYNTRILHRPYVSELQACRCEPSPDFCVNRYRICYTALKRVQALDNPNASPDGTKVLFNSNFLGAVNIFCAVARLPEPPVELSIRRPDAKDPASPGVLLLWKSAPHHAETAGYHVYRSDVSGAGFVPLTAKPLTGTQFVDGTAKPGEAYYYAVTAVEHGGLGSRLSDEAFIGSPGGRRRLYLEAENANLSPEMWIAFQGLASDLHYVWMRKKEGEGKAMLPLTLAQQAVQGPARAWVRVKGENGAGFGIAAGKSRVAINAAPSAGWTWVKADGQLDLKDAKQLEISSKLYGSALDCLVLTDDADFSPAANPRIRWPELPRVKGLKAQPTSPYSARLAWEPVAGQTVHHYNVYCGGDESFRPDQGSLVASPDQGTLLDWALAPGSTLYYRVTCVDRAGNESAPSEAAKVVLPEIARVTIEKDFADSVRFDSPAKDTYVVWLKLRKTPGAAGSYIIVNVDGKGGRSWVGKMDGLSDESWLTYDQWGRFELTAGTHTLEVQNKSGSTIEKVFITNDLSRTPPGHVNILTGW